MYDVTYDINDYKKAQTISSKENTFFTLSTVSHLLTPLHCVGFSISSKLISPEHIAACASWSKTSIQLPTHFPTSSAHHIPAHRFDRSIDRVGCPGSVNQSRVSKKIKSKIERQFRNVRIKQKRALFNDRYSTFGVFFELFF